MIGIEHIQETRDNQVFITQRQFEYTLPENHILLNSGWVYIEEKAKEEQNEEK